MRAQEFTRKAQPQAKVTTESTVDYSTELDRKLSEKLSEETDSTGVWTVHFWVEPKSYDDSPSREYQDTVVVRASSSEEAIAKAEAGTRRSYGFKAVPGADREDNLSELSRDTLKSYFTKRLEKTNDIAKTDVDKAKRIVKKDMPLAMKKLKDPTYGKNEMEEGWGAERQKQEADQSAAEWEDLHAKYAGDPEAQIVLNMLHRGGWNPNYAEKELLGAPGAKHNKEFWLDYAEKKGLTELTDIELDEKASAKLCRSTKRLGRSDYSSCVSQGLRAHQSKGKGHTDGHGNYLKGKKAKSTQYGGDVKDYDGK